MKRNVLVVFLIALVVPALTFAASADRFVAAKAVAAATDEVVVPLEITNSQNLVALDIPLGFSEGAVLQNVEFTDRVASFEVKIANIDNENHRVVIGLISMVSKEAPDLASGAGPIANLHFKLNEGVNTVKLTPVELDNPNHSLTYYYNDYSSGAPEVKVIHPDVETAEVSFTNGGALPTAYALSQNSPNPFNPTTKIQYALPQAGDVKISVFNILGQNVRDLVDGYMEAGNHEVVWDSKDRGGSAVASGVYFYKISATNFAETKKMVLLK